MNLGTGSTKILEQILYFPLLRPATRLEQLRQLTIILSLVITATKSDQFVACASPYYKQEGQGKNTHSLFYRASLAPKDTLLTVPIAFEGRRTLRYYC